jgi:phage protein U
MANVLLGVGPYRFEIPALAYDKLDRAYEFRWVPQDRIGRRPAMQFLGPGDEIVELRGTIYPQDPRFGDGFRQLESMRKEAEKGRPRGVASNLGRYYGRWCIVRISDVQSFFTKDGAPRKVEFNISLTAYA